MLSPGGKIVYYSHVSVKFLISEKLRVHFLTVQLIQHYLKPTTRMCEHKLTYDVPPPPNSIIMSCQISTHYGPIEG